MNPLADYTTKQLVEELARREGVTEHKIDHLETYCIESDTGIALDDTGPARILVVID